MCCLKCQSKSVFFCATSGAQSVCSYFAGNTVTDDNWSIRMSTAVHICLSVVPGMLCHYNVSEHGFTITVLKTVNYINTFNPPGLVHYLESRDQ